MSLVFVKSPGQSSLTTVEMASLVGPGQEISGASILGVSPLTVPSIAVTVVGTTLNSVQLQVEGGVEGVSYGVRFAVALAAGGIQEFTLAVLVKTDLNIPYQSDAPLAVPSLVGEVRVGDAAVGNVTFLLPPNESVAGAYVLWELMSPEGEVVTAGNCYDLQTFVSQFSVSIVGQAIVHVPSSAQPSASDQKYMLRWSLIRAGESDMYSFEGITVLGLTTEPIGVHDMVELHGDIATAGITLTELYENVTIELFSGEGNVRLMGPIPASAPKRVGTGWYYQVNILTDQLIPSVVPYVVSWKYFHSATPGSNYRETARLFLFNPSILSAIEDCRQTVNKAKATLFQFADMMFDTATLATFLRRGMDMFNGAGGIWTAFNMTNATGGVRDHWLGYSEVAMLQAQALAEGEKAFDFQGQAIQLTVDRAQYYDKMAADTLSRLEANVRPFKQNLQMKGVTEGDGNVNSITGNRAQLGISIHAASQFGRSFNGWARIR